ncbi:DNA-binding transcriptional regulator, GntR family [Cryobacterium flavum]|uniref:DNA-binding transcriptional regulator, GntR family n=1 Tax=Cryobacterium flavum TaxID=1424659 RepID=A0A4R8UZS5_9MICO|nr:GntR family transcriptional regulator [Cryobacterium flavum]TFB73623.1 GntR family transcriptional regulator [Cryobacterium flavum]SDO32334.1 DNA-binding transcriptional regulator, GntR family [Cryobacterium flavum]
MTTKSPLIQDVSRTHRGDRKQLSEDVAAYVRDAIMVGELPASSFIRTEHIAREMGVSATPVREALMILQSEGTVRWEPRRGFRVIPITRQDIEDLFTVQAFIAGELAAKAARLIDKEAIAKLWSLQNELESAASIGDATQVDALNHLIHRAINIIPNAQRLISLLGITVHYVPLNYFGSVKGWAEASAHDHGPVFRALEAGDADAARLAMSEHIQHIGRLLTTYLEERGVFARSESPDVA